MLALIVTDAAGYLSLGYNKGIENILGGENKGGVLY